MTQTGSFPAAVMISYQALTEGHSGAPVAETRAMSDLDSMHSLQLVVETTLYHFPYLVRFAAETIMATTHATDPELCLGSVLAVSCRQSR